MNLNLRILLIIGSINIYSNDLISSINNLILNDLEFVQQTNINSRIDESVGKIYRKNNFIQVEILKPSKEKYIIKDNLIEVHDFDFNQISYIDINDQDLHILSLLKNGIDTNNIKEISTNTFIIDSINNSFEVEFKSEDEFILSYKDNMNFRNTINFKSINKQ
jgi:hypothetical protein